MGLKFFHSANVSWWDPESVLDKRSFVYEKQLKWVLSYLPVKRESKALDIGAGRGRYTRLALNQGYEVVSVDINPKMLKIMEKLGLKNKKMVMKGEKLAFKKEEFDVVFAMEVFMHVPKVEQFFSEINRVLKPKGIAYLNITNKNAIYPFWVTKISPSLSKAQQQYPRIQYSPAEYEKYIRASGFKILHKSGFGVVPPLSLYSGWKGTIIPKFVAQFLSALFDPFLGYRHGFCVNYVVRKEK